jgi:spermidine synthase
MTKKKTSQPSNQPSPSNPPASRRYLPLLIVLFVGSGCAALIYEIVWFQLLQLVIGSSAVSLGVLLGTFMGGMCLGSLLLPRLISAREHPLRVYALIELGIGLIGIAVFFAVPLVGRLYLTSVGYGFSGILLRGVICAVCLLPPTMLMGATLPAIARWVEATPQGVSWLGFFYGGNIAGAVFGCLLAGFYLLRVHDMATATYAAAAINLAVALISFGLASVTPRAAPSDVSPPESAERAPGAWAVYLVIALSGLCALAAEVIWTRLLSLMLGATVYTFSLILAVFLVGLGIGSSAGAFLARRSARPRVALGVCQLLLTGAIAWTSYLLTEAMPYWPIKPDLSTSEWITFQIDLVRCVWATLPAACLWGASFPLALAAVASRGQDPGRLVGGVYAANTVGAILGAVGASLVLIPWLGTQQSQRLLIVLSAAAAFLMFVPLLAGSQPATASGGKPARLRLGDVLLVASAGLAVWLSLTVAQVPHLLVAYGRYMVTWIGQAEIIYMGEGINSSVAVSQLSDGVRNFHVSGKVEASSEPQDMRLQRMLGHIPALFHPHPRSVLVVGCGAGVTAGSFVPYPSVERIVIAEIEPLIPTVVSKYFSQENNNVVRDPRVQVIYDDARHYVLTTSEKFDVITSDPIHPWVKGSATLYTKEYFEMVKQRLNPGGVVTQWVPLYESNAEVVKSEIATFFEVFPQGTIWANLKNGEGYDVVLLGQAGPMQIDVGALQARLDRPDHVSIARALTEVGLGSAVDLLATYAGQNLDLGPWLVGAEINRDRNLRLQYLAGLGLNYYRSERIYAEMLAYRRFPDNLFLAPDGVKEMLRDALARP